jgi:hypothetical protein
MAILLKDCKIFHENGQYLSMHRPKHTKNPTPTLSFYQPSQINKLNMAILLKDLYIIFITQKRSIPVLKMKI